MTFGRRSHLNDSEARLAAHRRGGMLHGRRKFTDDWRSKYGTVPTGDPKKSKTTPKDGSR